jgi:hypothetical protein
MSDKLVWSGPATTSAASPGPTTRVGLGKRGVSSEIVTSMRQNSNWSVVAPDRLVTRRATKPALSNSKRFASPRRSPGFDVETTEDGTTVTSPPSSGLRS